MDKDHNELPIYTITMVDDELIVAGELGEETGVPDFRNALNMICAEEPLRDVVLDLRDVTYISSAALIELLSARKSYDSAENNPRMRLRSGMVVHRLFQLTNLTDYFDPILEEPVEN